jgi:type IV secretion system protein VirD4
VRDGAPGAGRPLLTGPTDGLLVAVAGGVGVLSAVLLPVWAAGAVAARLSGGPWPRLRIGQLVAAGGGLLTHGDTRGWPPPAPPAGLTRTLTALFAATLLAAAAVGAVAAYRRGGRPSGLATRADLTAVLSVPAARSAAATARPSLTRRQRRRAPAGQLGVPLGRHRRSQLPLWAPWTDCHGLVAPTQSGKTLRVAVHQLLAAPGFVLATSTKPDLLLLTALARLRTGHPVWLLDPTGIGPPWPYPVRWSPVTGCTDLVTAERRADALVAAGPSAARSTSGSDGFFAAQARSVLAGYLAAADLSGKNVITLLGWVDDPADDTAARVLRAAGLPIQAGRLAAAAALIPETRDGIYATIANAVGCLSRPDVLSTVTPPAGEAFDVEAAIRAGGTVYVLGSDTTAGSTAPLVTAFVEEVIETARTLAVHQPGERLDPPALALLDEVANMSPVPHLPETISDTAGRGVVVAYVLQSLGQARARWGADRAAVLLDNSTSLLVLGGGKSDRDLAALARLGGQRYRSRRSHGHGDRAGYNLTIADERLPVLDPADLRRLRPGDGLLFYRHLPPALVHARGIWADPGWPQLAADREAVRAGTVPTQADPYRPPTAA